MKYELFSAHTFWGGCYDLVLVIVDTELFLPALLNSKVQVIWTTCLAPNILPGQGSFF